MAPLTDPDRLNAYKDALANWIFGGRNPFIQLELNETALRWVKRELGNIKRREIGRLMHEYVEAGGEIDEVAETRPEWLDHDYHYDLRLTIQDKPVYIETRLVYQPPFQRDRSSILVVNIHAPK